MHHDLPAARGLRALLSDADRRTLTVHDTTVEELLTAPRPDCPDLAALWRKVNSAHFFGLTARQSLNDHRVEVHAGFLVLELIDGHVVGRFRAAMDLSGGVVN